MGRTRLERAKEEIKGIIDTLSPIELDNLIDVLVGDAECKEIEEKFNGLQDRIICRGDGINCPNRPTCRIDSMEGSERDLCESSIEEFYSQEVE